MSKKYAVITGGSSGLGLSFAKEIAAQGYIPIIISRNSDRVMKAVESLKTKGFEALGFNGDISIYSEMQNIAQKIKIKCGTIDFLILNAGVVNVGLLTDWQDVDKYIEDIKIDLIGTVISTKVFVSLLKTGSKILMVSSAFGIIGGAGYSTYCAAKAGIIKFAESLRRELLIKEISVYVACPADINTPQYIYEQQESPNWLKKQSARRSLLEPDLAAKKILTKCVGKRQIIIINFEILLLYILTKILPERFLQIIGDLVIPRPKK